MFYIFISTIGILICFADYCYSEEKLDVEMLPTLRSKQYLCEQYQKFVVFSAPRTGSSAIYNVFRYLFEDNDKLSDHHNKFDLKRKVLKTHRFVDVGRLVCNDDVLFIFTLRNPIDACISNYRINTKENLNFKEYAADLMYQQSDYLEFAVGLQSIGKNVLILKFEDFSVNIDNLIDFIEKQCSISIDSEDKELIRKGYSKENVFLCTKDLADFNEYLPISGYHGNHIKKTNYKPQQEFINWLYYFLDPVKFQFRKQGYFINNSENQ